MALSVDFSSSSKEPQRSQALRRSQSEMCIDPSNASADKRASTGTFSSADMPSAKRRAANAGSLHDYLFRFNSDIAIKELCDKMAENHALVQMGEELLESLEDAIAEKGTSKFDAQKHFATTVKRVWQNGHFNYLLFKTLENQDSFLPAMIQDLSMRERFEERMSRVKEDHYPYFKSIVKAREPAAMMSCEDVHPDLDEEMGCTVAVRAPVDDSVRYSLELFESLLLSMKMNGAADAMIDALRGKVESSGATEPHEFYRVVKKAVEEAADWLIDEGSPIPELSDELFIMELAVELERETGHKIVTTAKSFLEKLHTVDPARGVSDVSLVGKELSKMAAEVLKDECFVRVLREKTERDPVFRERLSRHKYRYTRRELLIAADAAERVVRIKKDPFCADTLKEREGAGVLRGFLIILIGYYIINDVEKLVGEFQRERRKKRQHSACIEYESGFAGDVEGLEKLVQEEHVVRACTGSVPLFSMLRRIQFQREVLGRRYRYDVCGTYGAWLINGSFVHSLFSY